MKCIGRVLKKYVKSVKIEVFSFVDEDGKYGLADKGREMTMQLRYNWIHDKLIENMDGILVFDILNGKLQDVNRLNLQKFFPIFDCVIKEEYGLYYAFVPNIKDNICEKYNEMLEKEKDSKWVGRSKLTESKRTNPIRRVYLLHSTDKEEFLEFCESIGAKYKIISPD